MSAWNISSPADLLANLALSAISNSNQNTFSALNSAGTASAYAKILAQQLAQVENEMNQSAQSADNLSEATDSATKTSIPVIETIKRFRPDGSIMITTYKDGSIDSTTRIKPHLVPVPDYNAPKTPDGKTHFKYEKRFTTSELLLLML